MDFLKLKESSDWEELEVQDKLVEDSKLRKLVTSADELQWSNFTMTEPKTSEEIS